MTRDGASKRLTGGKRFGVSQDLSARTIRRAAAVPDNRCARRAGRSRRRRGPSHPRSGLSCEADGYRQ